MKLELDNENYTDIFRDLSEKWHPLTTEGSSSTPPEIRLLGMIILSGLMFHMGSTMEKPTKPTKPDKPKSKKNSKMKGPSSYSKYEEQINERFG